MSFFRAYIQYTEDTESPRVYHRWCAIATVGALLSRSVFLRHGHTRIFPTLYSMLIGEPAARKSTAIKLSRKLASRAGYGNFAADRSSKEKFLLDLATGIQGDNETAFEDDLKKLGADRGAIAASNLWGVTDGPKEVFIVADEFNEFIGSGNNEFCTTLGNLWDWDDEHNPYTVRFKSGSVDVQQPTVSILSGNTQENFARAFPPELISQGFLSRFVLIFGARTSRKIAFPKVPSDKDTEAIITFLKAVREHYPLYTEIKIAPKAFELLTAIYELPDAVEDIRFTHYNQRRFTHLLRLCLIVACSQFKLEVEEVDVVEANTYLAAIEAKMPDALGEFGKGKNSTVANAILQLLEEANRPVGLDIILNRVRRDLDKPAQLTEILSTMQLANLIQNIPKQGWLPIKRVAKKRQFVDWSLLTAEEQVETPGE